MKRALFFFMAIVMTFACAGCDRSTTTTTTTTTTSEYSADGENGEATQSGTEATQSGDNNSTGNNGGSGNSGNGGSGSQGNIQNPLSADLKGATITIYQVGTNFSPDTKSSKEAKARADMLEKLKKELNCKIQVKKTTNDNLKSSVTNSAAAGKALCHLIETSMYSAGYYVASGLVTDLSKVSTMDFSKDYMNRYNITDSSKLGKGTYAVATEGWNRIFNVYFNKRILKEMGKSDTYLYNLAKTGKWNLKEYNKLAKAAIKDLDGKPGLSDKDQYGQAVVGAETGAVSALLINAGGSMLKRNSAGKLVYNMEDKKVTTVTTEFNSVMKNGGRYYGAGTQDSIVDFFASGKSLFLWSPKTALPDLSKMKDDFGLLPSPKYGSTSNYKSAIDWNCLVVMMPAGLKAQEQANAGAFVQAYEYLLSDVIDASINEAANRYLRDDESKTYLTTSINQMTSTPDQFYAQINEGVLTGTYRVIWDYLGGKNLSMASSIESRKNATIKALNELNKKAK